MARLAGLVPLDWSDHNVADPGVTLAEQAAFALADLHYRISERRFTRGRLRSATGSPTRSGTGTPPWFPGRSAWSPSALASAATSATVLEPLIRACASYVDAVALLSKSPWRASSPRSSGRW